VYLQSTHGSQTTWDIIQNSFLVRALFVKQIARQVKAKSGGRIGMLQAIPSQRIF
jgi:hypothetical protein